MYDRVSAILVVLLLLILIILLLIVLLLIVLVVLIVLLGIVLVVLIEVHNLTSFGCGLGIVCLLFGKIYISFVQKERE